VCPPRPSAAGALEGPDGAWPRDPDRLLAHLNAWDTNELELHARPETRPDQTPSGETNGWVQAHLERLGALGVSVAWNARQRCYGITSP